MPKPNNYYSLFSDERDEKIAELEEKLAKCSCGNAQGGGMSGGGGVGFSSEVQQELNYLESCLREEKAQNDELNDEVVLLRDVNCKLMNSISSADVEAVNAEELKGLKKALDVRNQDLNEAKMLIEEMRQIISSKSPDEKTSQLTKMIAEMETLRKARDAALIEAQKAKETVAAAKKDAIVAESLANLQKINKEVQEKVKNAASEREKALKAAQEKWSAQSERRMAMEKRRIEQLEYDLAQCKLRLASPGDMVFASDTPLPPPPKEPKEVIEKRIEAPAPPPPAAKKVRKEKSTTSEKPAAPKAAPPPPPAAAAAAGPVQIVVQPDPKLQAQFNELKKQNIDLLEKLKAVDAGANKVSQEEVNFFKKKLEEKEKELQKMKKEMKDAIEKVAKQDTAKSAELEKKMKTMEQEAKRLTDAYQNEMVLRKKYYNMVEDMKGKIRVYCRIRPISKSELERGNVMCVTVPDEYTITVDNGKQKKDFQYDRVFTPDEPQEAVFTDVENLIQSAFDGYNVCIFAYGQTGSGKTWTMVGNPEKMPGIGPRSFKRVFQAVAEGTKFTTTVSAYMLELYNDKLLDLLANNAEYSDKLEIKKDSRGLVVIPGAMVQTAANDEELFKTFQFGLNNRHVASTKMNAESSRSHLVLGIMIETVDKQTKKTGAGKLSVIDLAGSERVSKSGVTDDGAKEANAINMSLSALGDVISALTSEAAFVPYRNNKLTMLMQDSLGGNAKTLMFVNVSPVDYNAMETINSLNYASRVKLIKNEANKNIDSAEVDRLKKIIVRLQKGEKVDVI